MPSVSRSRGAAFDAEAVVTDEGLQGSVQRDRHIAYLTALADEADSAVEKIQAMLDGVGATLATKKTEARAMRAAADLAAKIKE